MVSNSKYRFNSPRSFPEGAEKKLFFNSDNKKFLLKTNGKVTESLILLFFWLGVLQLSVGGWWWRGAETLVSGRLK